MPTDDESLRTVEETYNKLNDLKNQLTALVNISNHPRLRDEIQQKLVDVDNINNQLQGSQLNNSSSSSQTPEHINNSFNKVSGEVRELAKKATYKVNIWNKAVGLNKMARFLLFIFMFFFIFKVIDHILDFFDVNKDLGYIYFVWFTIMFFLFVILPLQKSRLTAIPKLEE